MSKNTKRKGLTRRRYRLFANTDSVPCCYCNEPLSFEEATVEHIVSVKDGGGNSHSNLTIACGFCNSSRLCGVSFEEHKLKIQTLGKPNLKKFARYYLLFNFLRKNDRLIERKYLR